MVYCLDYSKTAHCRIISVQVCNWLSSRLHYLCITSLRDYIITESQFKRDTSRYESDYNTKNSVHEYYYMLRWVSMQLQKSIFAALINAWILAV